MCMSGNSLGPSAPAETLQCSEWPAGHTGPAGESAELAPVGRDHARRERQGTSASRDRGGQNTHSWAPGNIKTIMTSSPWCHSIIKQIRLCIRLSWKRWPENNQTWTKSPKPINGKLQQILLFNLKSLFWTKDEQPVSSRIQAFICKVFLYSQANVNGDVISDFRAIDWIIFAP